MKYNPINHLKDRNKYRQAKFDGREMKGYEEVKFKINLQREIKQQEAWKTIVSILLVALVIALIYAMVIDLNSTKNIIHLVR